MTGKTRAATKKAAAGVAKVWESSTTTERDLTALRNSGYLTKDDDARVPGDEMVPRPPAGYRVLFVAFLLRGLSLPAHEFFRGLLFFYGLQPHHLAPNSILQIACFITLCECFLGCHPHWGLWRHLFYLKRHSPNIVGGYGFCRVAGLGYFDLKMVESIPSWKKKWFYIKDRKTPNQRFGLPEFVADATVRKFARWSRGLTAVEEAEAAELMMKIESLRVTSELSGIQLISTFIGRRVQPLQNRPHGMWEYSGARDVSRVNSSEMITEETVKRVRNLTLLSGKDNRAFFPPIAPFSKDNPTPEGHVALHQYPPIPEAGDLNDDATEVSGSSHFVAEAEADDAVDVSKKRQVNLIEDSDDSTGSTPAKDLKGKGAADASASAPPRKKAKAILDEIPSSSDSFLDRLASEEQVADSKELVPSPEEVQDQPQPLRRIRRGLDEETLDVAGLKPAFASSAEYHDHPFVYSLNELGRKYVDVEADRDALRKDVLLLVKDKEAMAAQLEPLQAKLREAEDTVSQLKGELFSKEKAVTEMRERLESPLRQVVETLSTTTGEVVKLPGHERGDTLEQAVALIEASSSSMVSLFQESRETLERILKTLKPKEPVPSTPRALLNAFDPEDDPVDSFSERQQKSAFVSLLSLMMAHGEPVNLEKVTSSIPTASGQPVDPRVHIKHVRPYCSKILDVLAEYNDARRKALAASSSSAATKAAGA